MLIKIGKKGEIIQGFDDCKYIFIQDDKENTGGYLILTSKDKNFQSGYDNWVEDYHSLEQFFLETNLQVEWIE